MDSAKDDYEKGVDRTYALAMSPATGETAVNSPHLNRPTDPFPVTAEDLDDYPVYLRFEPAVYQNPEDHWAVQYCICESTNSYHSNI